MRVFTPGKVRVAAYGILCSNAQPGQPGPSNLAIQMTL
jgi:hypothetical protein